MGQRIFKGKLLLNWKTGGMRLFKRLAVKHGPWEIPVELNIVVQTPDVQVHSIDKKVTLSDVQISEMNLDEL